jgi:hypothetical protein
MLFRVIIILSGIFWSGMSWGQKPEKKSDQSGKNGYSQSYDAFMATADYASNTNLLGNFSNFRKQPYYSPSLSYFSRWGADLSLTGYAVDNSDDSLEHFSTEMDFTLGYGFEPVRNLTLYGNYSHFFYSRNSNSMKSIFANDLHLDADYTYKFADLGFSAGYLSGLQQTFYASIHNCYTIHINGLFVRNGTLTIQPGLDANFGDYEYLNLYYLDKLRENTNYSRYLILNPFIRRYVYFQKLKHPELSKEQILYHYLREKARDTFKFTSASISLPFSYTLGNFGINLGIYMCIPVNQPDYINNDLQFFFDMGLSYLLVSE